jgi:hypothetical protein
MIPNSWFLLWFLTVELWYLLLKELNSNSCSLQGWRLAPSKQHNKLGAWRQLNQLFNKFTWKSKIYISQIIHLYHKTFSDIFALQLWLKVSTFWHTSMNIMFQWLKIQCTPLCTCVFTSLHSMDIKTLGEKQFFTDIS